MRLEEEHYRSKEKHGRRIENRGISQREEKEYFGSLYELVLLRARSPWRMGFECKELFEQKKRSSTRVVTEPCAHRLAVVSPVLLCLRVLDYDSKLEWLVGGSLDDQTT